MKVALYQSEIIWENKEKNIEKLKEILRKLDGTEVDLILLPEMSFTGFSMNIEKTKEYEDETIGLITELAKEHQTSIGFGWVKAVEEKAENHYSVICKNGEMISDYVKIHPFSYSGEDEKFIGGNDISYFCMENTTFSTFICYDLRFPEIFQIASEKADVIIIPANWPEKRRMHWKCLLQARAIENQVYILAVNCVGNIGDLKYSGDSCIITPNGDIVEKMEFTEGIIIKDISFDVKNIRNDFPVKKDRREELYKIL